LPWRDSGHRDRKPARKISTEKTGRLESNAGRVKAAQSLYGDGGAPGQEICAAQQIGDQLGRASASLGPQAASGALGKGARTGCP
jgi:hypothetical protein